jgi:hypothetical protein
MDMFLLVLILFNPANDAPSSHYHSSITTTTTIINVLSVDCKTRMLVNSFCSLLAMEENNL